MNMQKYFKILNIDDELNLTHEILKKKYRLQALKYHPDRNKSDDANARFLEIQEAYDKINEYIQLSDELNSDDSDDQPDMDSDEGMKNYQKLLFSFIRNVVKKTSNNLQTNLYKYIFEKISTLCEEQSIKFLEKIDKSVLVEIHRITSTYKDIFLFGDNFIEKIENILRDKMSSDECIILHPLIDDLMDKNVYKLVVGDNIFMVPLWHHELIYDNSGSDIYVQCHPILPDNITIDENNGITVKQSFKISEIFDNRDIVFDIGKKKININVKNLSLVKNQTIYCYEDGIPQINTENIYNIDSIGGIFLEVELYL